MASATQRGRIKDFALLPQHELTHIAVATGRTLTPGAPDLSQPQQIVPTVQQLRPLTHRTIQISETPLRVIDQVVDHTIRFRGQPHPTGVHFCTGCYHFGPDPGVDYKEAARRHRRTAHYHNRPIAELQLRLNARTPTPRSIMGSPYKPQQPHSTPCPHRRQRGKPCSDCCTMPCT